MQSLITLSSIILISLAALGQSTLRAKPDRMETRILVLAKFGSNPQGGVSRMAYTESDKQGRQYIIGLMKSAGLEVRIDAAR